MRLGSRKFTLAGLMVLVGTLSLLLAACGGTTTTTGQAKAPDAQQVFKLGFGVPTSGNDFDSLDPATIQFGSDYAAAQLIWPSLVSLNKDLAVVPWAADGLPTISADGLTYTFKVKPGLKWSDGTPIDANTFAYSINRSLDPCTASPVAGYLGDQLKDGDTFYTATCTGGVISGPIKTLIGDSINVIDSQTLALTIKKPAGYFLAAMTYPTSWAQPKQLIDQYKDKWLNHLTDGTGFGGNLYKVTTWDHAGKFTLTRNDAFWGTKPVVREIDYTLYYKSETMLADYRGGTNDAAEMAVSAEYPKAKTEPGFHEVTALTVGFQYLNWAMAPFNDVRMRQAIALSLNKQALADTVNKGFVVASNHIVPKGMPGYNPNLKGPDGTTSVTGNTAKAKQLADAYAADKCGGALSSCGAAQGFPLTLTIRSQCDACANSAAAIQQMVKDALGIQININPIDRRQQVRTVKTTLWTTGGWIADFPDPWDFLSLFFLPGAQENKMSANVPEANVLMEKADASSDQAQRIKDYQAAEQLLVTNVGYLPTSQYKYAWFTRPYVVGYDINAGQFMSLDGWQKMYIAVH